MLASDWPMAWQNLRGDWSPSRSGRGLKMSSRYVIAYIDLSRARTFQDTRVQEHSHNGRICVRQRTCTDLPAQGACAQSSGIVQKFFDVRTRYVRTRFFSNLETI